MIGTTLAHYRITAALGAGGMGEVWRATDEKLGREVALKVLPADFAADPQRLERFQREAKVLASLNHPNIATLYGLETVVTQPVIPSESSESRDLSGSSSPSSQMAAGTAAPQGSQADAEGLVGHASRVPDTDAAREPHVPQGSQATPLLLSSRGRPKAESRDLSEVPRIAATHSAEISRLRRRRAAPPLEMTGWGERRRAAPPLGVTDQLRPSS